MKKIPPQSPERRASSEPPNIEYKKKVTLHTGDWYITNESGVMLVTILGSCISACIRDPLVGVGGMNHFLLPNTNSATLHPGDKATRYGAFAMEQLINSILIKGGHKDRLEVKLFGGGNVIKQSTLIGSRNVDFARRYLKDEGFSVAAEDLGGSYPRRIHYFPETGKVMMRTLQRASDYAVVEEERKFAESLETDNVGNDVDLF